MKPTGTKVCCTPVYGTTEGKWHGFGLCKGRPVVATPGGEFAWCKRHAPTNPTVLTVPVEDAADWKEVAAKADALKLCE